jgi:hypothetical protein
MFRGSEVFGFFWPKFLDLAGVLTFFGIKNAKKPDKGYVKRLMQDEAYLLYGYLEIGSSNLVVPIFIQSTVEKISLIGKHDA